MSTDLFRIRDLAKVYGMGEVEVHALRNVESDAERRRVRGPARPLGFRQVDAPQHHRRPGRADARPGLLPRPRADAGGRSGADRVSPPARRVRLPVLQPHPQPHGGGERRPRHGDLGRSHDAGGGAAAGRPGAARDAFPGAALGRRAAARGHRPRRRETARRPVVRRADRRARHLHRDRGARGAGAGQQRAANDDGGDHPQRRDRPDGGSGGPPCRRPRHGGRRTNLESCPRAISHGDADPDLRR